MRTAPNLAPISVAKYLTGEEKARHKHEYVEGAVYAMVGGTNAHNIIATNATISLGSELRGKKCRVFNSDTKVRIYLSRGTRFYYPDAMVVCRLNEAGETFQDSPVVIVEVTSESTRRTDANEKRDAYLSIDSLCVYVRVEQSVAAATVDRRKDNEFESENYSGMNSVIPLPEIDGELKLSDLYEDVEFVQETTVERES